MLLAALLLTLVATQTVTETGTTLTTTATIEQIDYTTRQVTLKFDDNSVDTLEAGPNVTRFDQLKVGDKIKFHYYESVAYQLHKAGSPEAATPQSDESKVALTPGSGAAPSGTAAKQRRETVTVTKVDPEQGSITVKAANGNIVSRRVKDKKNLEGVAPGDHIEIVYTEALLVSVDSST
jgi:Cu/Ag efflux protein CusF